MSLVAAVLCLLALSLTPASGSEVAPLEKGCAFATANSATATKAELRKGVSCLIAHKRKAARLHRVSADGALKRFSQSHARTMIKTNCLSLIHI